MNLSTGTGTLVHELTHALVDFDFPAVPAWFNEGLASLHEQCRFRSDRRGPWIEGLVNWRLPALKRTAASGHLRSLETLLADPDFRGPPGRDQLRAGPLFLHVHARAGRAGKVLPHFRRDQTADPRGLKTVAKIFPDRSWQELDDDFQRWLLTLEMPDAASRSLQGADLQRIRSIHDGEKNCLASTAKLPTQATFRSSRHAEPDHSPPSRRGDRDKASFTAACRSSR